MCTSDGESVCSRLYRDVVSPLRICVWQTAPGVCSWCLCIHYCVCVHLGWVKCRAQIPSMGNHTWPHVTSLNLTLFEKVCSSSSYWFIPVFAAWMAVITFSGVSQRFRLSTSTVSHRTISPVSPAKVTCVCLCVCVCGCGCGCVGEGAWLCVHINKC